ncbi:hypothetical protein [Pseudarthrobacter sp. H2]|uniref:hypothetical protein n=1 Tax=Pseudarthrobacter sp. H2 TaxID=3418415 RepID=UPI003CF24670
MMTDSSSVEEPEKRRPEEPQEPVLRGRYVEGDYGKTGRDGGRHADDEEGQYSEGDYGAVGSEGELPEPLGGKAKEAGRYVKADYGDAGAVPGRTAESEIGRYSEGDYGADGKVDPARKARTDKQ